MRRYTIQINNTQHDIEIEELSAEEFDVVVDGVSTRVRLTDHADLAQAVITPDVVPGSRPTQSFTPGPRPQGELDGIPVPSAEAHRPAPAVAAGPVPSAGSAAMTAPMPGVVLSVDAAPGQSVARGDLIMVIEAMKMKNEIRASRDGVIASIPVAVGDQVKYGDVLLQFGAA